VARVGANHPHAPMPADYPALLAHLFDRC
jgi:hypothetical protein